MSPFAMRTSSGLVFSRRFRPLCGLVLILAGIRGLGGCGAPAPFDVGVTTGGAKDIAYARSTIENGGVPEPDAITVEGFLSEHSIPITTPENPGLLNASSTVAWHLDFDGFTPLATVQIGFGTNIDRESFERSPLNLCLVIDRSGSMAEPIDARTGTPKLDAVRVAIDRLLGNLNADDRVSVVTFSDGSTVRLEGAAGDDAFAIKSALDGFAPEGGTELVSGLLKGYETVQKHHSADRSDRLFVFTDALLTDWNAALLERFYGAIDRYAKQEIGATFFGVGTDFGHDISYEIAQKRGGNYFFLSDYERIVQVFEDEFEFLVTPVAYDVGLDIAVPFEFDVAEVYGLPVEGAFPHAFRLSLPTLFLSSREGGGAIFVRLRAGSLVDFGREYSLADIELSYTTPDGRKETLPKLQAILPADQSPNAEEDYFQDAGAKRGVLLLNTALTLKRACEDYYGRYDGVFSYESSINRAVTRLTEFSFYFADMAASLEDATSESSRTLTQEQDLFLQLRLNIQDILR